MLPSTRCLTGYKLWHFSYTLDGKGKMLSLGKYPTVSLKEAREKSFEYRLKLLDNEKDLSHEPKPQSDKNDV